MITDSYDINTEPIISPSHFYGEKKHIVDICLVLFSYKIYNEILENYPCEKIGELSAANGRYPIYKFEYEGMKLGFYLSGIGSTLASQFAIEVNWLTGASKFIMFGSAGSLDEEKTGGKFVVPTESYRDEGMSYHYAPPKDYITIRNHEKVIEVFESLGVPYVSGRVWTTDAMLRETAGQVEKRKSEGCIAVEMELAGMQSVCDFYGMELYNFLVTGDVLAEGAYEHSKLSDANHNMDKFRLALEIAKSIQD